MSALKSARTETLISVGSDTTFTVEFRLPCHPREEKTLINAFNPKATIKSLIFTPFHLATKCPSAPWLVRLNSQWDVKEVQAYLEMVRNRVRSAWMGRGS